MCGDNLGTNVESWTIFVKYDNFEDQHVNHHDPIFHHDDDQCMTISHHDNSPLSSDLDSDTFFRHPRVAIAAKPFLYLSINNFFICRKIISLSSHPKTFLFNYEDKTNYGENLSQRLGNVAPSKLEN